MWGQISAGKTLVVYSLTPQVSSWLVERGQYGGIVKKTCRGFLSLSVDRIWSKISKLIVISIKYYSNHRITKLEGVVNTAAC